MALAVGDILQLTDVQAFLGQQVLNVYFYRLESFESGVTYQVLADQWETLVRTPIRNIQSVDLSHTALILKNLTNGIDIWTETDVAAGTLTGTNNLPSFYSVAFRLIRSGGLTRHGSKRFAGALEAQGDGNSFIFPAGTQAALETALGTPVAKTGTLDQDFVMTPVIVGRVPTGSPGAGELDLSVINPVQAAQYIRVTTQSTRRAGRGA